MNPLSMHNRYLNGAPLTIARKPYRSTEKCLVLVIFCTFVLVFCGTFYLLGLRSSGVARFSRAYKQVQDVGPDFLIPPPPRADEFKDKLRFNRHLDSGENPHLIEDRYKLKAKIEEDQRNHKMFKRPDFFMKIKTSSTETPPVKDMNLDQPIETFVKKTDIYTAGSKFGQAHTINAQHKDLIHDVAYNFYGNRMATCSSDQTIKIHDQDEHGNWNLSAAWKAHNGSVWKVTWAHPEYGQVIAACSFDRTASIWEEIIDTSILKESGGRQWVRRANLVDSRTSVTDVKFTPKNIGLFLTTCSADGILRIYEAPDIMNLSVWTHQHEVTSKLSCSCLSWTHSFNRLHIPLVAVGSDDSNTAAGPKVLIYEYSEAFRKFSKVTDTVPYCFDAIHDITFATTHGRSYHLLAIATKNVRIVKVKPIQENIVNLQSGTSKYDITVIATFDDHYCTVWRVSWNVLGTVLASSGDDGCVRLWKSDKDYWKCVSVLKADGSIPDIPTASDATSSISSSGSSVPVKARYYKLGSISHPNQVPNH